MILSHVHRVALRDLEPSLHPAGREDMVSAALSELGHLGAEAHAKALALTRGVEWGSLDPAGGAEMESAAIEHLGLPAFAAERDSTGNR